MFYSFYFQIFVAIKLYLEKSAVFKILENRSSSKSFRSIKLALFKMSRYKRLTVSINKFSFKGSMLRILAFKKLDNLFSKSSIFKIDHILEVFAKRRVNWSFLWCGRNFQDVSPSSIVYTSRASYLWFLFRLSVSALPHSSLIWAPITNSTASEKEE